MSSKIYAKNGSFAVAVGRAYLLMKKTDIDKIKSMKFSFTRFTNIAMLLLLIKQQDVYNDYRINIFLYN